jgi:hypothetical protein
MEVYLEFWPYILIFLTIMLSSYFKSKNRSSIINFVALFLFSALRFDVGWDYTEYVGIIKGGFDSVSNTRIEPLSKFILQIGAYLEFYPIVFIIFSFFTLYFVHKSITRYSSNVALSWLVFFSLPLFFLASLSTIRQSVATAIVLFSFKYIYEKKHLKFLLLILISTLLHYSSIIGLLLIFICKKPFNKITNTILIFSSFLLSEFLFNSLEIFLNTDISLIKRYVAFYIDAELHSPSKLQYIYYFIAVLNLLVYDKLVLLNPINKIFIAISSFGLFLFNVLSFEPVTASRVSAFFIIFWIFLIPEYSKLVDFKSKKIINGLIYFLFIIMVSIYLNIYVNAFESKVIEKNSFIPYRSWIFNL